MTKKQWKKKLSTEFGWPARALEDGDFLEVAIDTHQWIRSFPLKPEHEALSDLECFAALKPYMDERLAARARALAR